MRKASKSLSLKSLAAFSLLALFSCSIPFFGKGRVAPTEENAHKLATFSGILQYQQGCEPGQYRVMLKGLFEGAGVLYETKTDDTGKFSIMALPGKYLAEISKGHCEIKQPVELENNTEHMFLFSVQEYKAIEKVGEEDNHFPSRLPASVLVPSSKSN